MGNVEKTGLKTGSLAEVLGTARKAKTFLDNLPRNVSNTLRGEALSAWKQLLLKEN